MKEFLIGLLCLLAAGATFAAPHLIMDTTGINFVDVVAGVGAVRIVDMLNAGDEALTVNATVSGDSFLLWSRTPFAIPPGDSGLALQIAFMPPVAGDYTGMLTLTTDDPQHAIVNIPITGHAVPYQPPVNLHLLSPTNGARLRTPITFCWTTVDVSQPVTYTLWIINDSLGGDRHNITFNAGQATSYTVSDSTLIGPGSHVWRVTAEWGSNYAESQENYYFITETPGTSFEQISPFNGEIVERWPIDFTWEPLDVAGPVTYALTIESCDSNVSISHVYVLEGVTSFNLHDSTFTEGTYHWHLTASWSGGLIYTPHDYWFTYRNPSSVRPGFDLISPSWGDTLYGGTVAFTWHPVTPLESGWAYQIVISPRDSSSENPMRVFDAGGDTTLSLNMAAFPNGEYYWWAAAYHEGRNPIGSRQTMGFWHFAQAFPQSGVADKPVIATPRSFGVAAVYPNPFNPETRIQISVPQTGPVRADVFDILGRHVATLVNSRLAAGRYEYAWRADGPAGLYLLRLTGPDGTTDVRRLMYIK
jgi:hypothetical protein